MFHRASKKINTKNTSPWVRLQGTLMTSGPRLIQLDDVCLGKTDILVKKATLLEQEDNIQTKEKEIWLS